VQQHYLSNDVRRQVLELLESTTPDSDQAAIAYLEEQGLNEVAADLVANRSEFEERLRSVGETRQNS
jgi:hypothetical protein